MIPRTRRPGIALLAVLIATSLLMILGAVVHHVSLGEQRRAAERRDIVVATTGADAGVYRVLRDWQGMDLDTLAVGDTVPLSYHPAGSATVALRGVRLSPLAWLATAVASFPDSSGAVRRASLLVRQDLPEIGTLAALTVRDAVSVTGTGQVIGTDTATAALAPWCVPGSGVAGVSMADTTRLTGAPNVLGLPPLLQDAASGTMAPYDRFGSDSWAGFTARAQVVLAAGAVITPAPVVISGACDKTVRTNWGSPVGGGPCARHAPIVHARGSIELRGGVGQGILLVDGDLTLSAGARFHGIIVTRDDLRSGTGGGVVLGTVLAADTAAGAADHSQIGDGLRVERAGCVVRGVLGRHAPLVPIRQRAWAPM